MHENIVNGDTGKGETQNAKERKGPFRLELRCHQTKFKTRKPKKGVQSKEACRNTLHKIITTEKSFSKHTQLTTQENYRKKHVSQQHH